MSDIDQKIRQALSEEDRKAIDRMEDNYDPLELALLGFKGSQRIGNAVVWILGFVFFFLLLYCGYRYFAVDNMKESLTWAVAMLLCGMSIVIVKIIASQVMQTQVLIREIKRLELRVLTSQKQ